MQITANWIPEWIQHLQVRCRNFVYVFLSQTLEYLLRKTFRLLFLSHSWIPGIIPDRHNSDCLQSRVTATATAAVLLLLSYCCGAALSFITGLNTAAALLCSASLRRDINGAFVMFPPQCCRTQVTEGTCEHWRIKCAVELQPRRSRRRVCGGPVCGCGMDVSCRAVSTLNCNAQPWG